MLCDWDSPASVLRRLRWHGRDAEGRYIELGYNSQLPSGSAAVLTDKLVLDADWTARRRAIADAYTSALAGTVHRPIGAAPGRDHIFHKYVVSTPSRDRLTAALANAGVPTRVHYPRPLYQEPMFGPEPRGGDACPAAEAACARVLSLPIHAYLTDDEVERITTGLRQM